MKKNNKRFSEYESRKVKGITLDELENNARQSYKKRKRHWILMIPIKNI